MQNSGVTLRAESQHFASVHDDNPCVAFIPYFGFIEEIWELNYVKFNVCVFKCKWVDSNTGVRTDDVGFTLVDLNKLAYQNDPFIMAEQAKQVFYIEDPCDQSQMATQPNSPPPPPPSTGVASHSSSPPLKWTRKASRLRSLATRPVGAERPLVHVDPVTGKADGPHNKKFRTYLGIVTRDKVDVTYENWKHVPITQKDLIWEDIQAEFDIPEASDLRTKKILQTVGERWRQFKSDLTSKWALAADKDSVDDTVCKMYGISKEKWAQFCQSRRDPSWEDALEEQASQGSFVTHGRHDMLTAAIGRPEHPGRVRVVGAGITIKQYFGSASRTSSIAPEYLQQFTQQIKDQLEDSITEKVTRRLMLSLSQMQSQGLALPSELDVGPSAARVSTKESCVDPSGNNPNIGDSYKCRLYIEEYPSRLVALGRIYEGSTTIHNIPLLHDQVKVGVEEIRDADAPIPVPTKEVKVMGQALNTFLAWLTHLVKRLLEQVF
ncbi:hypothetical protein GmHk_17G049846 [Glycine max]|nr:hypothetical protein GmHk_17G049846 [Glycine max]